MRFNTIIVFTLLLFYLGSCEPNKRKIVQEVVEKYSNHQSITYDVQYLVKNFGDKELNKAIFSVLMQREKKDNVFGGKFLYKPNIDSFLGAKYYDSKKLFLIDGRNQVITKYDPQTDGTAIIKGSWDGDVLETFFLNPGRLNSLIENKRNTIIYSDSANTVKVSIHFPTGSKKVLYIDESKKTIEKIISQVKHKGLIQRKEWVISNIVFDSANDDAFQNIIGKYFAHYKIKEYEPPKDGYYALMEKGEPAPPIKGYAFPDYSEKVKIETNKLTILEFWYTSCLPCIKMIPYLNKLKEKYGKKIQIIGINDKEIKQEQKDNIKSFLQRTPINYQILLVEEVPKAYNVKSYPTLYIIGKDNKVEYSKIGYSKNLFKVLDKKIKGLLKNQA